MDDTLKEFIKNGLDADAALSARSVLVIGGPDTGKTTLARALAAQMDNAALVDLDMGQSNVGPPATVAWGRSSGDGEVRAEEFYFTGSLSPPGSLLPTLAGARYMLDCALAACERAIIDTTGLVAGPVGLVLKQYKIELLSPDVVVADFTALLALYGVRRQASHPEGRSSGGSKAQGRGTEGRVPRQEVRGVFPRLAPDRGGP